MLKPKKQEVKELRLSIQKALCLNITQAQDECAKMLSTSRRTWQQWESGDRGMHPAFWELAKIKERLVEPVIKFNIELDYNFDTVLDCGRGVYEIASGIGVNSADPLLVIRMGTFSKPKEMKIVAEQCRSAKTEGDLKKIASRLNLTDDRISIS